MSKEHTDELNSLVVDAAALFPSLRALLEINEDGHRPAIFELLKLADDRMEQLSDAVYRLQINGEG